MSSLLPVYSSGSRFVDDLLSSRKWAADTVSFSFTTSARAYKAGYGNGETTKGYAPLSAKQAAAARDAMAAWDELIATDLVEGGGANAVIRLAASNAPNTAWAYLPGGGEEAGDVWIGRNSWNANPTEGNYAYLTILHEIGHALGLRHPHEASGGRGQGEAIEGPADAMCPCCFNTVHNSQGAAGITVATSYGSAVDAMAYSVMSYRSFAGQDIKAGYTNETWGYAQSPMARDIAAIQHLYGANYETRAGDTVYRWNPQTGEKSINGVGQGAPGGNKVFETIWDGGGSDTFDLSNFSSNLTIDLAPGGWTDFGNSQLARLGNGQFAPGNVAIAYLHEGDARAYIENAIGGSGNDTITGNAVSNILIGGAGNDTIKGVAGNNILVGGNLGDELDLIGIARAEVISVTLPALKDDGNDILIGGTGNDIFIPGLGTNTVDGGGGANTLILAFSFTAIAIETLPSGALVFTYEGGSTTATNIDFLALEDGIFSLNGPIETLADNPLVIEIALLYRAGLGRELDEAGTDYWTAVIETDADLAFLALSILGSDEFAARFGRPDILADEAFVDLLYANVLSREADDAEIAFWTGRMAEGSGHDQVLMAFAFSDENRAGIAEATGPVPGGADLPIDVVAVTQPEWAQIWA